nr:hypothetical protein GCM10020092_035800 [Actinoplanes digitatis]
MREGYDAIITACEALGEGSKPLDHVKNYGAGIDDRLTGMHETAPWNEYSYGVSDRGASVRIPWQVEKDRKGYIEDRRPNANVDPYLVTRLIVDTCCTALEKAKPGLTRRIGAVEPSPRKEGPTALNRPRPQRSWAIRRRRAGRTAIRPMPGSRNAAPISRMVAHCRPGPVVGRLSSSAAEVLPVVAPAAGEVVAVGGRCLGGAGAEGDRDRRLVRVDDVLGGGRRQDLSGDHAAPACALVAAELLCHLQRQRRGLAVGVGVGELGAAGEVAVGRALRVLDALAERDLLQILGEPGAVHGDLLAVGEAGGLRDVQGRCGRRGRAVDQDDHGGQHEVGRGRRGQPSG